MKIPTPDRDTVARASTYQLLLWWCLCPLDPEEAMFVEEEMRERLEKQGDHVQTIALATGLEFSAN